MKVGKIEFVTFMLQNYDKLKWIKLSENEHDEIYIYSTCIPKISDAKYIIHVESTRLTKYMTVRNQQDDVTYEINEVQDDRIKQLFQLVAEKVKVNDEEEFFQNALDEISKSIV